MKTSAFASTLKIGKMQRPRVKRQAVDNRNSYSQKRGFWKCFRINLFSTIENL
jgi:hypothetical protein